jgi:hypothetical protein
LHRKPISLRIQRLEQADLPDGLIFRICVKPVSEKCLSSVFPKYMFLCRHPASARGALRVVTNVGCGMRWTPPDHLDE